jgi:pyruvate dehydrogenase E1 component alpha subunit
VAEDRELRVEMLRRIMLIRRFEERVKALAASGELAGAAHSYVGEEAVAVGACLALRQDDYITGNHRSHGHPIAKGGDVRRAMAELLGKADGYCKGKGGSMHLADFSIGILGESGVVASAIPIAVGAALASRLRKDGRVALAFLGDGATAQGAFHESVNLAAVWKLPVIFVCENNQYGVTNSVKNAVAAGKIADMAGSYNIPGVQVDGQDVVAVYEAVTEAVQRARAGAGPSLVEGLTYRYEEHALGLERILKKAYRPPEEVARWRQRDPLQIHKERLLERRLMTENDLLTMEAAIAAQIDEAVRFARESPYPQEGELYTDMYAGPAPA